jgi:uncharacterized protein (DUF3084 family)
MKFPSRTLAVVMLLVPITACKDKVAIARADTLEGRLTEQQALTNQLNEQKDSLTRVVLDADAFLGQMDSAISTVRGLPRTKRAASDPLADQLQARKDMQERVKALVARAKTTANQLAELQKQQAASQTENTTLKSQLTEQVAKIEQDAQLIADLGSTIDRQNTQIASLEARLDSLGTEVRTLGSRHYQAYYVIGTEKELMDKGIVMKEGGANLLVARPGRTLVPARVLDAASFTALDQREMRMIMVPDTTKRYRIVSRQSLDAADVSWRDERSFKGNLKISKPDEFWAPSRFLILVQM